MRGKSPHAFNRVEAVSTDLWVNGQVAFTQSTLQERQAYTKDQLTSFGRYEKLIEQNKPYPVYLTPACFELQERLQQ